VHGGNVVLDVRPGVEIPIDPSVPPAFINDDELDEVTGGVGVLDRLDVDDDDGVVEPRPVALVPDAPIDPVVEEPVKLDEPDVPVEDNRLPLVLELRVEFEVGRLLLVISELVDGLALAPSPVDVEGELDVVSDEAPDLGTHGRESGLCAGGLVMDMGGFI